MISLLYGYILYLFRGKISILSLIDSKSILSKKASVYRFARIRNSIIDDYTYVGPHSRIMKTQIGKFCSIADYCTIGLPSHTINLISTSPIFTAYKNGTKTSWVKRNVNNATFSSIKIGNDVWIGTKVIIMSGVTIGDGAIIGAGAIVTKDVPPYAIVAGVPSKILRYRFDQSIVEKLLNLQWWNLPEEKLKNKIDLFQNVVTLDSVNNIK